MKSVLLFNIKNWNLLTIQEYLKNLSQREKPKIRFGFSHILAIFNGLDQRVIPDSENAVLCIEYDKKAKEAVTNFLVIQGNSRKTKSLDDVKGEPNNIVFDLHNFGFIPEREKEVLEIYNDIVVDSNAKVLEPYQCRDLLQDESLNVEIKKYLLDIYALVASGIQILISLQNKTSFLKQYAGILADIFIVRAKLEKSIFLIAKLDDTLKYNESFSNAKRVRTVFLEYSQKSEFKLTKELRGLSQDFEHFDSQFRTPEAHKRGRIFPLISDGYYGTLINEVLSFDNRVNRFFGEVVQYLRGAIK